MVQLLARVLCAPILILGGSLAQKRLGQSIGGRLVGLPLTSLPLLSLLALSDGRRFAGRAAEATLTAVVAQSVWCLSYAISARRRSPLESAGLSTIAFGVTCLALYPIHMRPLYSAVVAAISVPAVLAMWPEVGTAEEMGSKSTKSDLPARAAAGTAFTVGLTALASTMGARAAGLLTAFPVLTVVMACATHLSDGRRAADRFLESVLSGSLSVVTGLATFALVVVPLGLVFALPCSIAASVAGQFVPMRWATQIRPYVSKTMVRAREGVWLWAR